MKASIALLLLFPLTAFSETRVTPEVRIAPFNFGSVAESFVALIPTGNGHTLYANTIAAPSLVATPIRSDGTPDVTGRRRIAPPGVVARSGDGVVAAWIDGGYVWAMRVDSGVPATQLAPASSVQAIGCDSSGCLVAFATDIGYAIATDAYGRPLTGAMQLPPHLSNAVSFIAADPNGFMIARPAMSFRSFFQAPHALRVDRHGTIVYDVALTDFGGVVTILWTGERYVVIGNVLDNRVLYIAASDLSATGALSPRRLLIPLDEPVDFSRSYTVAERSDGFEVAALSSNHVKVYAVDRSFTAATPVTTFDVPFEKSVAAVDDGIAVLAHATSLFTMQTKTDSFPSLASYGPLPQQARGIARAGDAHVVVWTERESATARETVFAAHVNQQSIVTDIETVAITSGISTAQVDGIATGEALIVWITSDFQKGGAAIVQANGIVEHVDLGDGRPDHVVGTSDGWVVIANTSMNPFVSSGIRVTRGGFVFAPNPISSVTPVAADYDGATVMSLASTSADLLAPDGRVLGRTPLPFWASVPGSLAFSVDSYLFDDGQQLRRLSREGQLLSETAYPANWHGTVSNTVAATRHGWVVLRPDSIASVLRQDPPLVVEKTAVPGVQALARHGDDSIGVLVVHDAEERSQAGSAVFFRAVQFEDSTPRRRAVSR